MAMKVLADILPGMQLSVLHNIPEGGERLCLAERGGRLSSRWAGGRREGVTPNAVASTVLRGGLNAPDPRENICSSPRSDFPRGFSLFFSPSRYRYCRTVACACAGKPCLDIPRTDARRWGFILSSPSPILNPFWWGLFVVVLLTAVAIGLQERGGGSLEDPPVREPSVTRPRRQPRRSPPPPPPPPLPAHLPANPDQTPCTPAQVATSIQLKLTFSICSPWPTHLADEGAEKVRDLLECAKGALRPLEGRRPRPDTQPREGQCESEGEPLVSVVSPHRTTVEPQQPSSHAPYSVPHHTHYGTNPGEACRAPCQLLPSADLASISAQFKGIGRCLH